MSTQKKALEIINKFYHQVEAITLLEKKQAWESAKQCALIVVDEVIGTDMLIDETDYVETKSYLFFWVDVRKEILKTEQ